MGLWAVPWSSSLKGPQGARPCPGHPSSRGPGPSPDRSVLLDWNSLPLEFLFLAFIQSFLGLLPNPGTPFLVLSYAISLPLEGSTFLEHPYRTASLALALGNRM